MPISLEAPTRLSAVIRGVISTSVRLLVVGVALPVLGSASIGGPQVARSVAEVASTGDFARPSSRLA